MPRHQLTINVTALHELIEAERASLGVSLRQLERLIGVPASTISRLPERTSDPAYRTLRALFEWLEASAELFDLDASTTAVKQRAVLIADARKRLQRRDELEQRSRMLSAKSRKFEDDARGTRKKRATEPSHTVAVGQ